MKNTTLIIIILLLNISFSQNENLMNRYRNDILSETPINPIPKEIPQGIWTMCESSDEIIGLIKKYSSNSDEQLQGYKELGKQVRENYFEPVTKESVCRFLELSN